MSEYYYCLSVFTTVNPEDLTSDLPCAHFAQKKEKLQQAQISHSLFVPFFLLPVQYSAVKLGSKTKTDLL